MKKLFVIVVIIAITAVFYTEKTGITNFRAMFAEKVLGIDPEEEENKTEDGYEYTLDKPKTEEKWDPAKAAIRDADSYHKEAKDFAAKTNNAVEIINEK